MANRRYGQYTVETSNEDKVLFPDDGITKGELIDYYDQVAEHLLPYVRDRPLAMRRWPDGIEQEGFFQKQVPDYFPDWIERTTVAKQDGRQTLAVCRNRATLVYLADQACITPHGWLSRTDQLDHPDQLIIDLDPPGDDFEPVRRAARWCRDALTELDLTPFVRTTGSRGVHVVVPLDRGEPFDAVRGFARDLAGLLARRHQDELTDEQRKDKRRGRLYLDVARNAYAQTAVVPYAVRARPGAPVATPIDWDELADGDVHARSWTIRTLRRRLGQRDDPWTGWRRYARGLEAARGRLRRLLEKEGRPQAASA